MVFLRDYPPQLSVPLSWREIYLHGAFGQRELISESPLSRQAKERSIDLGIGRKPFEELDQAGALQPIAFAEGGYWPGFQLPAIPEAEMTFREERGAVDWAENYSWDAHGYPEVSAMYSPWQVLYLDDVVTAGRITISLETLLLCGERREKALESVRGFYEREEDNWKGIDEAWRPLLKTLVTLQNRYWPHVSGRVTLLPDPANDSDWIEAGRGADPVPAEDLLALLGASAEELTAAYHYLVSRGIDREPADGLIMLRRARPRPFQSRWRGHPRRAQDNFDAAELLRLFLVDLLGTDVDPPSETIMDGRQGERASLFQHGPAAAVDREKLKQELVNAELYPHGVEVIVEGPSEMSLVDTLVAGLLGPQAAEEVSYFDLEGVGAAKQVIPLATSLGAYAIRTLLLVDREGRMGPYAERAVELGTMEADDVCLAEKSLEEDNASPEELIALAAQLAAAPPEGIEAVELAISAEQLLSAHQSRIDGAHKGEHPALAGTLVEEAENHDPPVRICKPDLAEALARQMVREFEQASGDAKDLEHLYRRRPALGFVVKRVIGAINRPVPMS